MALRAHRVHPAYERAAGGLDTRFYTAPLTPVMDRLNHYGQVRALVFGNHGEASPDVHHFISAAARRLARTTWDRLGARSEDEAYSCHVQRFRRDVGIATAREFARYRLLRVPFFLAFIYLFIGVPRPACCGSGSTCGTSGGEGGASSGAHAGRLLQASG